MEGSNEFNNQKMQTKAYIICINDEIEVNQISEEIENPNLQIEVSRMSRKSDEKKINKFCNNYKLKEKTSILIIKMHFFCLFIVLTIT
jgi:hypothetical protein